jgi:uncharacterized protein YhaN
MKRIIRLTESDLTRIVRRVIVEQDETAQADEVVKNIDVAQYCSAKSAPSWVVNILNKLPEDKRQKAKEFIKNFANAVSGKSVKELLSLRKQIKQEKQKAESTGNVNEQLAPIVIAGTAVSASLLIAIAAIILFIVVVIIISKSSKKSGGCGGPGWWNDL